jgi:two-component system chemotaxis response regulator CheY
MKILVVDDSRVMRSLVVRTLKAAGYEDLVEACSGAEALVAVRATRFDFVTTDWNMPEMDGLQFLQAARAEGITVPVGFVTSECTTSMIDLALSNGAKFVCNKPFTPESLSAALAGALQAQAA